VLSLSDSVRPFRRRPPVPTVNPVSTVLSRSDGVFPFRRLSPVPTAFSCSDLFLPFRRRSPVSTAFSRYDGVLLLRRRSPVTTMRSCSDGALPFQRCSRVPTVLSHADNALPFRRLSVPPEPHPFRRCLDLSSIDTNCLCLVTVPPTEFTVHPCPADGCLGRFGRSRPADGSTVRLVPTASVPCLVSTQTASV
jgi:hypothetical protein